MKTWDEVREFMIVYIVDEIEVFDDNNILIGKTKPFQKAIIDGINSDEIMVVIKSGQFDGHDFYYHPKTDNPSELLTEKEFRELKMTELKVWKDLKKFISVIDKLNDKSDDIIMIRELIEKNNK